MSGGSATLTRIPWPTTLRVEADAPASLGERGNPARPFRTLNEALTAVSAYDNLDLGEHTFAPFNPALLKAGLSFNGTKRPTVNSRTAPTALTGGTIIQGPAPFHDLADIKVRKLGIDSGSAVCTALYTGTGQEGLVFYNQAPSTRADPEMGGIIVEDVEILLQSSIAAFHALLLQHVNRAWVHKVGTWWGTHGVALKGSHVIASDLQCNGHATDGLIIKADTLANCYRVAVNNVICGSVAGGDGGGILFDCAAAFAPDLSYVTVTNADVSDAAYGVQFLGGVSATAHHIRVETSPPSVPAFSGNVDYPSVLFDGGNVDPGALGSGWAAVGGGNAPVRYRRHGARVTIGGVVSGGTTGPLFTLPAYCRPSGNVWAAVTAYTAGSPAFAVGVLSIGADGAVTVQQKSNDFLSLNCSFVL